MKRFIRYLYEYHEGKRVRNVGFVKVEQQEDTCVVHIHGKGLRLGENKELKLYIFYTQNQTCIGIPQGMIENVNPAVNYRLTYTTEDVGDQQIFDKIEGIILSHDSRYAAVWNDMPVDVDQMVESGNIKRDTEPPEQSVEQIDSEEIEVEEMHAEEPEEISEEIFVEQVDAQQVRYDVEDEEPELEPENETEPAIGLDEAVEESIRYEKIQRRDLSGLSRKEWRLANNSFLLHGYYNYHHLLLIHEKGNTWIGVPGVYHEKERVAAEAFGFTQFHRVAEEAVNLEEKEKNTYDDFGYWCRQVSR